MESARRAHGPNQGFQSLEMMGLIVLHKCRTAIIMNSRPTAHSRPEGARSPSMPSAFTRNYYHIVFSTKHRANLITDDLEARLYAFLGGIVRHLQCTLIAVNGMLDHVHLLIR